MHHHTELSFVDEFLWVLPLHYFKKRMTERCSSLVHVASGAATFTLLPHRPVAFLYRTATCRPLFKPSVSLLSSCKTIELWLEILSHFYSFHLTLPRIFKCRSTASIRDHWKQWINPVEQEDSGQRIVWIFCTSESPVSSRQELVP